MTVKNMRTPFIEKYQYITPDGIVYEMHDPPDRYVMFYEGDGIASAKFDVRSGPFQHGQSVNSYRLNPRKIDVIVRHNGCSREDYLTNRVGLSDILRHSRTGDNNPQPGQLRRYFADGTLRDLDVFLTTPPVYTWSNAWDSFSVQETLGFTAYNPIMYDPTLMTSSSVNFLASPSTYTTLRFPISFPINFSVVYDVLVTKVQTINYVGNWEEYPTIVVTGPGEQLTILHQETGDQISLGDYPISDGEVVTINLGYGEKTITNNYGASLLGYVSDISNLTRFRLLPDPLSAGGINTISATMSAGSELSSVEIQYKNRYEGK